MIVVDCASRYTHNYNGDFVRTPKLHLRDPRPHLRRGEGTMTLAEYQRRNQR